MTNQLLNIDFTTGNKKPCNMPLTKHCYRIQRHPLFDLYYIVRVCDRKQSLPYTFRAEAQQDINDEIRKDGE